ncbi:MAG: hypothetical protein V5A15_01725 [Haloarcula sp.]
MHSVRASFSGPSGPSGTWLFAFTDARNTVSFGWCLPRMLAISVLLTWVFNHTRGSVLHVVLLHGAVNRTEAFVTASLDTPFLDVRYGQVMTLLTVAAALVVGVRGRDLTSTPRAIAPGAQAR